jgi:hypothetical protein
MTVSFAAIRPSPQTLSGTKILRAFGTRCHGLIKGIFPLPLQMTMRTVADGPNYHYYYYSSIP